MKPTLVIGDVHGHLDRLAALLEQEGIIEEHAPGEWRRINFDVEVVQLGDLGHFGKGGSPTGDLMAYEYAQEWLDVVLWGNHDRAVIDEGHAFTGYAKPRPELYHLIKLLHFAGKLKLAHHAHGWFLSHAGLHLAVRHNFPYGVPNAREMADWLNGQDKQWIDHQGHCDPNFLAIRDAIGRIRGGRSHAGGILWRDISEGLWMGFPQVFGHSADHKSHAVRYCWERGNTRKFENVPESAFDKTDGKMSYCVDIGGKGGKEHPEGNCLMGIWLPEQKIVRVDLGA